MKKKIRKEIKNIIQTMIEAHNHISLCIQKNHVVEVIDMLSQCQDCALHIGDTIEKSEGMGTQAVIYLEQYCEQLYRMSKIADKNKAIILKRKLDYILHQVEYEIDKKIYIDKLKIVFMPYKVSMWDCMESIWEAAVSDKNNKVFVVPLPYYERDGDGKIKKECYEGELFPRYVPIVNYKVFSLEREMPDIIYIHNPYDGANYVTSVHPDYFSLNLKRYTDMLVYIPYYLCGEGGMPESHKNLPAYLYIDKIIVQDEEKAKSLLDFVPKEKIAIIGSPKVDKLRKLQKNKQGIIENNVPIEWKKKISNRKVILFNVSISGILQNSKSAINKIKYVLALFEKREDVVLLWRPHPLIEATLQTMRPEMYVEYIKIKDEFIDKDRGIFDETGEAGIAALVADAYLGEKTSSLLNYFGVLGKPILYINWECEKEVGEGRDFLYFYSFIRDGDIIYFVPANRGMAHGLYSLNLKNENLNRVMEFPGIVDSEDDAYIGIKKLQNTILLIPHNAEDIYVYDLIKKQGIKFVLKKAFDRKMLFGEAIEYGNRLFFIPKCYPAIVGLNIQELKINEFYECIEPFILKEKNKPMFCWAYHTQAEYLYIASSYESKILVFNMENGSSSIKEVGKYPYGYFDMIYDGVYYWLSAYGKNCIVRWNETTGEVKEYHYPIDTKIADTWCWSLLLDWNDNIIICNGITADILFFNKESEELKKCEVPDYIFAKTKKRNTGNSLLIAEFLNEEELLIYYCGDSSINIWNLNTNQWRKIPCRIPRQDMLEMERRQIESYSVSKLAPYSLTEDKTTISKYIDYIAGGNGGIFERSYECYNGATNNVSIGTEVHEYIKKLVE